MSNTFLSQEEVNEMIDYVAGDFNMGSRDNMSAKEYAALMQEGSTTFEDPLPQSTVDMLLSKPRGNAIVKYKAYHGSEMISELQGKSACILTDNGNGFKVKFPSHRSSEQDIFMSLNYSQASYLKECLNQWKDE